MSIPNVSRAHLSGSDGTSVLVEQVQSDSDNELLEVLEKVVSSGKEAQKVQVATPMEDGQFQQFTCSDSAANNRVEELLCSSSYLFVVADTCVWELQKLTSLSQYKSAMCKVQCPTIQNSSVYVVVSISSSLAGRVSSAAAFLVLHISSMLLHI
ncbi:hypothetical protein RHGRI_023987 [Rhododendron griersonianum]|uniref:Uncharacterized protein n=1 Tax=Rhododendron griersonianum TaxID=479676 RepID=A0AAV6J8Y5_9ERIC|nr:hypothetical protein RHGRI_023987 [Rhododendron griersonianum]